jgi:hypothetical protein
MMSATASARSSLDVEKDGEIEIDDLPVPPVPRDVQEWDHDTSNPRNWSVKRKAFTTAVVTGIGFVR